MPQGVGIDSYSNAEQEDQQYHCIGKAEVL